MATIIEMITAIVMLTPEDANLLKTTHPGILSFRLIYNSTFKYHSAKYKHKKQTQSSSVPRYRQTPTAQMNKFVYASLYYKKSHTTQLLSTQDKREMFRYSGYNNRSYRPFDFILAVLSIGDFRELELAYAR